jgi:putative transposase
MEHVYSFLDITRQAWHKAQHQPLQQNEIQKELVGKANAIRMDHRKMGCRKIASRIKVEGYGRDKTERLLLHSGFRIARIIKHVRTTQRQREMYFPNLIQGLTLNRKNQLIQTDITYYTIGQRHYYIVFIMDVYTRRITGYNVSDTMKASENIRALQMALRARSGDDLSMLIHHSDKGSQYIDREYLGLLSKNNVKVSMCDYAWQNAYCERLNRTIKEEYLETRNIVSLDQLKSEVRRAVRLYNHDRGHKSLLKEMSPVSFEQHLFKSTSDQHPVLRLHASNTLSTK